MKFTNVFSVENPERNVFLWGDFGTGKTSVSLETVKIKVSHCKEKDKSVRVIVTTYGGRDDVQLLANFREYLKNIDAQILPLKQLCENLNCKWDISQPKKTINAVIRSLSSDKSHQLTIFVCDEVSPCRREGQRTPDWTDIATADNVEWILAMAPTSDSRKTMEMMNPSHPAIQDGKLLYSYRNSYPIRSVIICFLNYISIIALQTDHHICPDSLLDGDVYPDGFRRGVTSRPVTAWYNAPVV